MIPYKQRHIKQSNLKFSKPPYVLSVNSTLVADEVAEYKKIEQLEKFKELAGQAAHDLRAPLQILSMALDNCFTGLSKEEHALLKNLTNKIRKIAQEFLSNSAEATFNYGASDCENIGIIPDNASEMETFPHNQHILVSQALAEVVEQKKFICHGKNIEFKYSFDPSIRFTFIYGNALNFERMMCNLINNSVDALEGNSGVVKVGFSVENDFVKITVEDDGNGMSHEIIDKLMRNESVSTTKKNGYGIGTSQIRDALAEFSGTQVIRSAPNKGTKITLAIRKSEEPKWITKHIHLQKGDTVVILYDDISMCHMWKEKFTPYLDDIALKFFKSSQDMMDFIHSFKEKDKLVLLSDYELKNQKFNLLDIIQNEYRAILVSNCYNRREVQEKAISIGIKILPLADDIKIILDEKNECELSFADVVVLDNEEYFVNFIGDMLRGKGLAVDTYCDPSDFIKNISKYNVNTKIITDNCFKSNMTGEALAEQLSMKGFTNICVLSGRGDNALRSKYPEGTNFIKKGTEDCEKDLMQWCKKL